VLVEVDSTEGEWENEVILGVFVDGLIVVDTIGESCGSLMQPHRIKIPHNPK
jgi:hypothetical protein